MPLTNCTYFFPLLFHPLIKNNNKKCTYHQCFSCSVCCKCTDIFKGEKKIVELCASDVADNWQSYRDIILCKFSTRGKYPYFVFVCFLT